MTEAGVPLYRIKEVNKKEETSVPSLGLPSCAGLYLS